jgi:hypothetical protein
MVVTHIGEGYGPRPGTNDGPADYHLGEEAGGRVQHLAPQAFRGLEVCVGP